MSVLERFFFVELSHVNHQMGTWYVQNIHSSRTCAESIGPENGVVYSETDLNDIVHYVWYALYVQNKLDTLSVF